MGLGVKLTFIRAMKVKTGGAWGEIELHRGYEG